MTVLLVFLPKNILRWTQSRLKCWWKTKKININILIAKEGAWAPSAPHWLRLWSQVQTVLTTYNKLRMNNAVAIQRIYDPELFKFNMPLNRIKHSAFIFHKGLCSESAYMDQLRMTSDREYMIVLLIADKMRCERVTRKASVLPLLLLFFLWFSSHVRLFLLMHEQRTKTEIASYVRLKVRSNNADTIIGWRRGYVQPLIG